MGDTNGVSRTDQPDATKRVEIERERSEKSHELGQSRIDHLGVPLVSIVVVVVLFVSHLGLLLSCVLEVLLREQLLFNM